MGVEKKRMLPFRGPVQNPRNQRMTVPYAKVLRKVLDSDIYYSEDDLDDLKALISSLSALDDDEIEKRIDDLEIELAQSKSKDVILTHKSNDVTSERSIDTVYQNTTDRPILVQISLRLYD